METSHLDVFEMAARRLAWIDRRQTVLAQNVSNADTPGYQARDIAPFAQQLGELSPQIARTDERHLAGSQSPSSSRPLRPLERAPDGNAVSVEDQLTKIADTQSAQALTTNLMQKYTSMFRIALGK